MQNNTSLITNFLIATSVLFLGLTLFILYLIKIFNKQQSLLKKNIEILQLTQQQNLLSAQLEIQENTFRKISEEIHDNISLSLTLAKLNLNTCDRNNPNSVISSIDSAVDLISKSLIDLNDISKSMDGDLIEQYGLLHTLEYEKNVLQRSGTHSVNIWIDGNPEYLPSTQELLIFRMIQEACNNIIKHAEASIISIRIEYQPQTLVVSVSDNGKGFDASATELNAKQKRSSGLKNIRNRASLMNGEVILKSEECKGSTITIKIPLQKNDLS